MNKGNVGIM